MPREAQIQANEDYRAYRFKVAKEALTVYFLIQIANAFGQTRFVWNKLKEFIDTCLEKGLPLPTGDYLNKHINKVLAKKYDWLKKKVDKFYFTHVAYDIVKAYKASLDSNGKVGIPNFRRKYAAHQSVQTNFTNDNIKVERIEGTEMGYISLPYFNKPNNRKNAPDHRILVHLHRDIAGRIHGAYIVREQTGDYYVVVICIVKKEQLPEKDTVIGGDAGLKTYLTLSDGTEYAPLRALNSQLKKIKRLQRTLARKRREGEKHLKEGEKYQKSKNYIKVQKELVKTYERVRNMRKDYAHKISKDIILNNQGVILENLRIKNLMQNHHLARAIADAAWYMLSSFIEYKAEWYGRMFTKVDTFFPSSQKCPNCGYINKEVKDLSVREWECPNCHTQNFRDLAAATNIRNEGLRILSEQLGTDLLSRYGNVPNLKPVEKDIRSFSEAGSPQA